MVETDVHFDTLICNALIVDGLNNVPFVGDVAVSGELIAAIGNLQHLDAMHKIDASGLCLSPGFVDVHTHDDLQLIRTPQMLEKISQGVTTVIVGNCGLSAAPYLPTPNTEIPEPLNILGQASEFNFPTFSDFKNAINKAKPSINVAALVGHTLLRAAHVKHLEQKASEKEIKQMQSSLEQAMQQGALGLSSGLAYYNAKAATTEEVMALTDVAAKHQGVYTTHLRTEFAEIDRALTEAFTIGNTSQLPLVISHLKCAGIDNWGRSQEVLALIENAQNDNDISFDCYPYSASSSNLDLMQVTDKTAIQITWSTPFPECQNQNLSDIAEQWQKNLHDTARLLQPAGAVYHCMHPDDVDSFISHDSCMIGSDGLPCDPHPHPRLWGSFPRVLSHYQRHKNLFSLEKAIHKMTALSCDKFKLEGRGQIAAGYFADLVLFDPETVADTATFEQPKQKAIGINKVWVNGQLSYEYAQGVIARAGKFLINRGKNNDN